MFVAMEKLERISARSSVNTGVAPIEIFKPFPEYSEEEIGNCFKYFKKNFSAVGHRNLRLKGARPSKNPLAVVW